MKTFTFVEVASEQAKDVIKAMKHGVTVKGRSVVCDVADKTENDKGERQKSRKEKGERGKEKGERRKENGERREQKGERRKEKAEWGKRTTETDDKRSSAKRSAQKDSPQQHHYTKDDWMKFLHPDTSPLKGETPDFNQEGWARRKPKKKK